MPSKVYMKACKGNEKALLELMYRIENKKLHSTEINDIFSQPIKSKYSRFLAAFLLQEGAPGMQPDPKKARTILKSLVAEQATESGFSYPEMLLRFHEYTKNGSSNDFFVQNKAKFRLTNYIMTEKNPYGLLWLASRVLSSARFNSNSLEFVLERSETLDSIPPTNRANASLQALKSTLSDLTRCYRAMLGTSWLDKLNEKTDDFTGKLQEAHQAIQRTLGYSNQHELFSAIKPARSTVAKLWLAMADYYKSTNQTDKQYFCLQHATEMNPKYEKDWISAIQAEKTPIKTIKKFMHNFIQVAIQNEQQIERSNDPQEKQKMLAHMTVQFKNTELFHKTASKRITDKELDQLAKQCGFHFNILKEKSEAQLQAPDNIKQKPF